ncbi:MAG: hypothetical protein ACKPKO_00080, partial [Candidatus Fonsibacter sp.]
SITSVPEAVGNDDKSIASVTAAFQPKGPMHSVFMSGPFLSTAITFAVALVGASGMDLLRGGGPSEDE